MDAEIGMANSIAQKLREDMRQEALLKIEGCFRAIATETETGEWRGLVSRDYIRELAKEGMQLMEGL